MVGKLVVKGQNRQHCILRLKRSLEEMVVEGIKTNIPIHLKVLDDPDFISGDYDIKWLEKWLDKHIFNAEK